MALWPLFHNKHKMKVNDGKKVKSGSRPRMEVNRATTATYIQLREFAKKEFPQKKKEIKKKIASFYVFLRRYCIIRKTLLKSVL